PRGRPHRGPHGDLPPLLAQVQGQQAHRAAHRQPAPPRGRGGRQRERRRHPRLSRSSGGLGPPGKGRSHFFLRLSTSAAATAATARGSPKPGVPRLVVAGVPPVDSCVVVVGVVRVVVVPPKGVVVV